MATNGIRKIPYEGLENLPIGVSVWGNFATDKELRGQGKVDIFHKALKNYRDDARAFWYYTVAPGHAQEVEGVVAGAWKTATRYCSTTIPTCLERARRWITGTASPKCRRPSTG
ncbi:MAG: hypothetical protein IPG32_17740 [Saprospirales bacterium]|nr:hypothetical protein [Saprospirales bacterium]